MYKQKRSWFNLYKLKPYTYTKHYTSFRNIDLKVLLYFKKKEIKTYPRTTNTSESVPLRRKKK